jgi:hypothetical protein
MNKKSRFIQEYPKGVGKSSRRWNEERAKTTKRESQALRTSPLVARWAHHITKIGVRQWKLLAISKAVFLNPITSPLFKHPNRKDLPQVFSKGQAFRES